MLPSVTIMMFAVHMVTQFAVVGTSVSIEVMIPAGMKYMLAIECSSPLETKAMIGNQIPKNFPTMSSEQIPEQDCEVDKIVATNCLEEC